MIYIVCIMAHHMAWSAEDLEIIEENLTFLKEERKRIRRLRNNGPMGEPWPKWPKISARVLDGPEKEKQKILCGEDLHQYLIQNCAEESFIPTPQPPPGGYMTLQSMTPCVIAVWGVVKKVGRAALCTYIDFGLLLRRAFALHKIEKDSGRRKNTWKMWLQQHVRISEVEVRKLESEMAALLAPYPGLRKLSLSYTEVYRRREQLSSLLESPGPYKDYWRQP